MLPSQNPSKISLKIPCTLLSNYKPLILVPNNNTVPTSPLPSVHIPASPHILQTNSLILQKINTNYCQQRKPPKNKEETFPEIFPDKLSDSSPVFNDSDNSSERDKHSPTIIPLPTCKAQDSQLLLLPIKCYLPNNLRLSRTVYQPSETNHKNLNTNATHISPLSSP